MNVKKGKAARGDGERHREQSINKTDESDLLAYTSLLPTSKIWAMTSWEVSDYAYLLSNNGSSRAIMNYWEIKYSYCKTEISLHRVFLEFTSTEYIFVEEGPAWKICSNVPLNN